MVKNKEGRAKRRKGSKPPAQGFVQIGVESWEQARAICKTMIWWAFRGQPALDWGLTTTIERATDYFNRWTDLPAGIRGNRERTILYDFQRRAHHYIETLPAADDLVEWFALIQHYGGPTRLLDFTHSFYVAAFFAIERALGDAVVWGVNLERLQSAVAAKTGGATESETIFDVNNRHIMTAHQLLNDGQSPDLVLNLEPARMNERLSAQQGLFLWPCNLDAGFQQNLAATFDSDSETFFDDTEFWASFPKDAELTLDDFAVVKITIPRVLHLEALQDLASMNLTARSLFPGLDGFARSLYYHLRIPKLDEWEKYETDVIDETSI